MNEELKNGTYESPEITVIVVKLNSVIATSGDFDNYTNEEYDWGD